MVGDMPEPLIKTLPPLGFSDRVDPVVFHERFSVAPEPNAGPPRNTGFVVVATGLAGTDVELMNG